MIRVLIVDDSDLVLDAVSAALETTPDCEVVGLAVDGLEAVTKAQELVPDVVIMDVQMPNVDGLEATRRIKLALPTVAVLLISGLVSHREAAKAAGGDGYITKPFHVDELLRQIRDIGMKYRRGTARP